MKPNSNPDHLVDESAALVDFDTKGDADLDLLEKGITVGYNAALARLTSIAAATLYNRLCQWTRFKGSVDNGWIYYTAKQYQFDTDYTPNTFTKAYKELVEVGLIEHRTTYIRLSRIKACHFRLTSKSPRDLYLERKNQASTNRKFEQDRAHKFVNPIYTEEKSEDNTDFTKSEISAVNQSSSIDATQPSAASQASSEDENIPFGADLQSKCVRSDAHSQADAPQLRRKRGFAVLGEIYQQFGLKGKKTAQEADLIATALDNGFTKEELKQAVEWFMRHEFWCDKTPVSWFSDSALKQFDASRRMVPQQGEGSPYFYPDTLDPDYQKSDAYKKNVDFLKEYRRKVQNGEL